jgi:curved DNA-binding protein CbpA
MLKDYYKIFGVKEDASEQEIRARWIELMRHYHPDVQKGMQFDEISKEINEAYQILKDPFSRADYDHNLAQHRYYGGKRVSHRLGFICLGSILFIAIIYMVITPSKTFIPSVSQPIRRNIAPPQIENKVSDVIVEASRTQRSNELDKQVNQISSKAQKVQADQSSQIDQVKAEDEVKKNSINPIDPINPSNPITSINQVKVEVKDKAEVEVQKNPINQPKAEVKVKESPTNPSNPTNPVTQAKVEPKLTVKESPINPSNPNNPTNPITQEKTEVKAKVKGTPINPTTQSKVEVKDSQANQKNQIDQRNPVTQRKAEVKVEVKVEKNQTNLRNQTNKTDQRNQIKQVKVEVKNNQTNQINEIDQRNPVTQTKVEDKVKVEKNQIDQRSLVTQVKTQVKAQKNSINPTDSINPTNPINQPKTKVAVKENSSNSINPINPSNPPNPSIAREEEVKKFFANYVGRYSRKDLIGFMSFFSDRAIQNQKDRLEGIKKIYFTFFNQSLELKYRLSDLKIEIYQNVVNVNAQYELDQISRNGRRNAFRGSIQWVLAREGGELKIVSLHYQQTEGESHEI